MQLSAFVSRLLESNLGCGKRIAREDVVDVIVSQRAGLRKLCAGC